MLGPLTLPLTMYIALSYSEDTEGVVAALAADAERSAPCDPAEGDVRLVGGEAHEGRVELLARGEWGTVCDDAFGIEEADVICRQLGYAGARQALQGFQHAYGPGEDPIWLDDLRCVGDEPTLLECPPARDLGSHSCGHGEDAGVICLLPGECRDTPQCDEQESCIGGQCQALAGDTLMRCGNSSRDVAEFIPEGADLQVVAGCVPNDGVRALLVTRGGAGSVDGDALRAYLEAGGRVITEFSSSDEVFNAVFPEANVEQAAARQGSCRDNINPAVRYNLDDVFWWTHRGREVQPEVDTGCGFNLSAYPGIVPLGGWDENSASLAYVDVGLGRLWLVEADWQDGNAAFSADSLAMMRYMIGSPIVPGLQAGVQQGVSAGALAEGGWEICYQSAYDTAGDSLEALQSDCSGSHLMMACRPVGADAYTLAAVGEHDEVFLNVGDAGDASHTHNDVQWYYSPTRSWGFAPGGATVSRSTCDFGGEQPEPAMAPRSSWAVARWGSRISPWPPWVRPTRSSWRCPASGRPPTSTTARSGTTPRTTPLGSPRSGSPCPGAAATWATTGARVGCAGTPTPPEGVAVVTRPA